MTARSIELTTLVVDDYDKAIAFFVDVLGFRLVEDEPSLTNDGRPKRWVVVRPPGAESGLLLARADGEPQARVVGAQVAGRVGFFLRVDDFDASVARMLAAGVEFTTAPRNEPYGKVAVFKDVFGNKWDLLGPRPGLALGDKPIIIGRSSSSFTRVTRIVAAELGIDCELLVVHDLMSLDAADYGENPALKLPSLRTEAGTWFGALNVARAHARGRPGYRIVWPEDLHEPLLANAQELTLQAMATEVALIIGKVGGTGETAASTKQRKSLLGTLDWLEANLSAIMARLPPRDVSFLEVTLYCLIAHLEFREVAPTSGYRALTAFCEQFAERASVRATPYQFDV
ncbi:MAG: VOC family protein [Myxococcales bacterium]|nr:VOC family protein [Myxococcales bacterium]